MGEEKPVIWSHHALDGLLTIMEYWKNRTGSTAYSERLHKEVMAETNKLCAFPELGRLVKGDNQSRIIIHLSFAIFYDVRSEDVLITHIWDQHQDPGKSPR